MSEINQSFTNRVQYTLSHSLMGLLTLTQDPKGWKDDDKELTRNEDLDGIFAKFSNSLVFVAEAAEFITTVKEIDGIQADLRLVKEISHPKTDQWIVSYSGYLDVSTYKKEDKGVSIKFNSGGIEEILKSRETEEVELDRLTSLDGVVLDPMPSELLQLDGRRIFLDSRLESPKSPDNYAEASVTSTDGNTYSKSCAIPLRISARSHEELSDVPGSSIGYLDNGYPNMMFFYKAEVDRLVNIDLDMTFKTNVFSFHNVNNGYFQLSLAVYKDGALCHIKTRHSLFFCSRLNMRSQMGGSGFTTPINPNQYPPMSHATSFHGQIQLLEGESLGLEWLCYGNTGGSGNRGRLGASCSEADVKLKITEDSFFEPTTAKFYLPHEALDRFIQIYTGRKNAFKSSIFGRTDIGYPSDGSAALIGFHHGFWIRGFDATPAGVVLDPDSPNLYKPVTTSLRNTLDSYSTVANIGMGIERVGYSEKVVVEDKTYFWNRNVTIRLPNQVKKVVRSYALKYTYSSVELGYDKGGSYDEAQGLDEFNGRNTYSTPITKAKNIYSKVSPFRADAYGGEFCRRKPAKRYPSLDTQYDTDIFLRDAKRGILNVFKERLWQDDFSQAPTGIYSPETATNLRLSPFNLLLKHGWVIAAGLTKNVTDKIRYKSSTGNSAMKTKLNGGNEYAENSDIVISELDRARYMDEYIEFEHSVDFNISQQLESYTMFGNEKVYNVYGLIEFINEDNETERGWLMSLKPNKEGKWKLLKFNKK